MLRYPISWSILSIKKPGFALSRLCLIPVCEPLPNQKAKFCFKQILFNPNFHQSKNKVLF